MKTLLLIDASALIHRAYHALPPLTTPDGEPIGAIYGLSSILIKKLGENPPDYIIAALDRPEPTFREKIFKEYKAHRPKAEKELVTQLNKSKELFQKFKIPVIDRIGFEADDIIGTISEKFNPTRKENENLKIVILTGDLDALQLVTGDRVVVETMKKGVSETIIYNEAAVKERFGLAPQQLPDYKGLVGDPSDNIPGIRGIGPKTAAKLLGIFGSLENLYERLGPDHPLAAKILPHKETAILSKKLATINRSVPIKVRLEDLAYTGFDLKALTKYLSVLGFQSLIARLLKDRKTGHPKNIAGQETPALEDGRSKDTIIFESLEEMIENKKILESAKIKVFFDWKAALKSLERRGAHVSDPIFDLKIAGWLIDPDQKDFSLEALARRFLHKDAHKEDKTTLLGSLFRFFKSKIKEYELDFVFEEIETPLIRVLAEMERWGIRMNPRKLESLKSDIEIELKKTAEKIYKLARETFNINSPRQVSRIIFDKLGVEGRLKRTPGGKRSTAEKALLGLEGKHPIINLILQYREDAKIKNAFVEPFLETLGPEGRLRTTFLQTGTATGRLSSEKPNLQNIPQESRWSERLRSAFEAEKGFSFVSFDYSQIELRILAHVTGDKKLSDAFSKGLDIHCLTASQVFNVAMEKVTPEMRRLGKTLNFGIIYGMGPKSFSETSGLTLKEAEKFIKEYFNDFPAVRDWQEKIKAEAKTLGYVRNLNGRRRWFLDAWRADEEAYKRSYRADEIERAAVNMPIQSLGADILKLAMVKSFNFLKDQKFLGEGGVKLILSIHDELLFEISDDILKTVTPALEKIIEGVYSLSVPLKVETKYGKEWGAMKNF